MVLYCIWFSTWPSTHGCSLCCKNQWKHAANLLQKSWAQTNAYLCVNCCTTYCNLKQLVAVARITQRCILVLHHCEIVHRFLAVTHCKTVAKTQYCNLTLLYLLASSSSLRWGCPPFNFKRVAEKC